MAGVTPSNGYPGRLPASWEVEQQRRAGQASGDDREPRPEKGPNRVPVSRPGRGKGLDDIGNAERFAWQHADKVRYLPVFGRWLVWDGCRWIGDETNTPLRLAQETALSLVEEASAVDDDAARGRLLKHADASAREPRLRAMLRIAESDPGLVLRPGELDADPWVLNASSGTIDLHTGELYPHRHEDAITLLAGAAYRPDADAPTWRAHLGRCQPDPDVRAFLQRLAGYSAIGDTQQHVIAISHGAGANGKSTTHNAISHALGDYSHQATTDLLTQPRRASGQATPELADLRGRRLVVVAETREDHRLAVEHVKAITGGDPITARHLYSNLFTFEPSHTVWLQTNHKPRITDPGHAIWRRVQLIPWTVTIPDHEQDPAIEQQLALELDGILAWIVQGEENRRRLQDLVRLPKLTILPLKLLQASPPHHSSTQAADHHRPRPDEPTP